MGKVKLIVHERFAGKAGKTRFVRCAFPRRMFLYAIPDRIRECKIFFTAVVLGNCSGVSGKS